MVSEMACSTYLEMGKEQSCTSARELLNNVPESRSQAFMGVSHYEL